MTHTLMRTAAWTLAPALVVVAAQAASPAPVGAERGMVVSAHALASEVGVDVLRRGGNAVDAAVAVGYALAVVYPAAGNLGGGGFMTLRLADGSEHFVDFRETAPGAARADMYLDADGNVVAGRSTRGHLAVGVPGTVAGLELARNRWGTQPRRALLAPAVALAERGWVLGRRDAELLHEASADFATDPASRAIFLQRGGQPWQAGQRLVQRDLARTLRAVASHGAPGFYAGPVGAAIARSSQQGGGLITQADLAAYQPRVLAPVRCSYRGLTVISAPPPSSGGAILCEMLNVLEAYPLGEWGWHSARGVHAQVEAMRHAYLDRNSYLGDPAFVANPLQRLLSKDYAAQVRAAIDPKQAGDSAKLRPGTPPHPPIAAQQADARGGEHTTHYSVVDRWGNAVAVTYTLNDWFGARVTAGGTGVLLNNEMDDFTAKPGVPNLYGLVQGAANAIAPGKRPLSSMSPTVVLKDGQPLMVLGTPGGSRIITAVLQTLVNVVDHGMTIQEAVDAPRFHQQWLPACTTAEPFALSPDTQAILSSMGHTWCEPSVANHMAAILVGAPKLGGKPVGLLRYWGAIDPRGGTGLAAGY